MAASLNRVTLIGNLGRAPEVRNTQSGKRIANLNIACTEKWKQDGQEREHTEWIRCVIMNDGLAGVAERFLRKGSRLFVEGKFQTRKWTDQSGSEKYTTEVVIGFDGKLIMLDGPREQGDSGQSYGGSGPADMSDDIPFSPCWE